MKEIEEGKDIEWDTGIKMKRMKKMYKKLE